MAKPIKKKAQTIPEVELVPDAWPRFENFIREIVKAGPQHRTTAIKSMTPKGVPAQSKKRQTRARS
jgi:hypothetical protein